MQAAYGVGSGAALPEAGGPADQEVGECGVGKDTAKGVGTIRARKVGVALNGANGVAAHLQAVLADDPREVVAPGERVVVARDLDLFNTCLEESGNIHHREVGRVRVVVRSPAQLLQIVEGNVRLVIGDGVVAVVAQARRVDFVRGEIGNVGKAVEVGIQLQLALLEAGQVAVSGRSHAPRGEYPSTELLAALRKRLVAAKEQLGGITVVRALVLVGPERVLSERHVLLQKIDRERIQAARRNDVAGKVLRGERVADHAVEFRKIAANLLLGGDEDRGGGAEGLLLLFQVNEPERAIAAVVELGNKNGTAARKSILIAFALDLLRQEEIAGIKLVVPKKLIQAAMDWFVPLLVDTSITPDA